MRLDIEEYHACQTNWDAPLINNYRRKIEKAEFEKNTLELIDDIPAAECLQLCIDQVVEYLDSDRTAKCWSLVKHVKGFSIIETKLLKFFGKKEEMKAVQYNGPLDKKTFEKAVLFCYDQTLGYCVNMKKQHENKKNDKGESTSNNQIVSSVPNSQKSTFTEDDSNDFEIQYLFNVPLQLRPSNDETLSPIWTLVRHKNGYSVFRSSSLKCLKDDEEIPLKIDCKVVHKEEPDKFSDGVALLIDKTFLFCSARKKDYLAVDEVATKKRQKLVEPHFIKRTTYRPIKNLRSTTTVKRPRQTSSSIKSGPFQLPKTSNNLPKIPKRKLYHWETNKPTNALYHFQLNFRKPESIQDPVLLNSFINVAKHMAPADVNCQSMPMDQSGWYSLLGHVDAFRNLVLNKCPKNIKQRWLAKHKKPAKPQQKPSESPPIFVIQPTQSICPEYDPDFPAYDHIPIQHVNQIPTDSGELDNLITQNNENLMELDSFLAENCPRQIVSQSDPSQELNEPSINEKETGKRFTQEILLHPVAKKVKMQSKEIVDIPLPLFKKSYSETDYIEIDAFYRIQRRGIISSANSLKDIGTRRTSSEPSPNPEIIGFHKIARALLLTHPILHCPKYIQSFDAETFEKIGPKKFKILQDNIEKECRKRVRLFVKTSGKQLFPKATDMKKLTTLHCRNNFSLKRIKSPDFQNQISETMTSIGAYTQCRLPRIFTRNFDDQIGDVNYWLGFDNQWEPVLEKLQKLRENEETGTNLS